jgi:dTDP-4-amino-4,6-dideoxygalactose transaminase
MASVQLFEESNDCKSAYWLFGFHVKNQLQLIKKLKTLGVPASVVHQRIDRNAIFGGTNHDLKNQALFDSTQVHIPMHDAINETTATYIIESLKKSL